MLNEENSAPTNVDATIKSASPTRPGIEPDMGPHLGIQMQPTSLDIWESKYQLRDRTGTPIDTSVDETLQRVAIALAAQEDESCRSYWEWQFLWALREGAVPAGRIVSNAGAEALKPSTSTINCTVSETIRDSMQDILSKVHDAGLTLRAGCGIGYEFSTLRPRGAFVNGAGATTSGPLSFMTIFDAMCACIASAGSRRGAQMATFDISHPDCREFIRAKREDGRLRQFNLSLLITDEFIEAVKADAEWLLSFPLHSSERDLLETAPQDVVWREWPLHEPGYTVRDDGLVACRVYERVRARELWDLVMVSTYDFAEPGFLLIDRMNELNNNWWCESIRASNPCGEQGLPPAGACLLGSINLTRFVVDPFTEDARFDWDTFREVVAVFTRMLDNVVELNGLPLERQREEIMSKRRHGMGYLGLGSSIAMLRMTYGDADSIAFTEQVTRELAIAGWRAALSLAKEKGPAPILAQSSFVTAQMLRQRPEMAADGYKVGDEVKNSILHARYSRYMQKIAQVEPELVAELASFGARFTHHSSIAPTGTIALSLGNNASNGIEPSFAHKYIRNVVREGRKSKEKVDVFSYELLAYRTLVDPTADPGAEGVDGRLPSYFISADAVTPAQHVAIQAAAQQWVDSSISKTVNVATDYPFEDFKDIYLLAHASGLKGCTTFRFNPTAFQGVLVKESDLAATSYTFTLEDGSVVVANGNEMIEYEGVLHSAANLFDSLKEGTPSR